MNQGLRQQQKQSQTQAFAPQLRQSLKILQVPALELRNTILEELQTNPTLEELPFDTVSVEEQSSLTENNSEENLDNPEEMEFKEEYSLIQQLDEDWREHYAQESASNTYTSEDAERRQHFLDSIVSEKSLQEHLMEQAELTESSLEELKAMEFLVGSLDDRGFLTTELAEIAEMSDLPLEIVESAYRTLKTFDPVGIGCRNVKECLLLELESEGQSDSIGSTIIRDHFDLLLRRRIPEIAKKMHIEVEDVQEALEGISSLDPAPGRNFKADTNQSVIPDITFEKSGEYWSASLNDEYIPKLRLSKSYKDLLAKGELNAKEKEYIRDKMRSGKFLISSIEQRQRTLQRIADKILETQKDFFNSGVSKLHPLTMSKIGEMLELHETTISRAISNKYAQTPYGLVEMKYFFTTGFDSEDGTGVSNSAIKEEIAKIIGTESPEKPFSDQKIVGFLEEKNFKVARRTVAKYREELGILPTNLRRKY